MGRPGRQYTAKEVTTVLMAVVAWGGNVAAAVRDVGADHDITISEETVGKWIKDTHIVEYSRLRDEHGPELEAQLAHAFRGVAQRAVQVQVLALEKAQERLENNQDADPAKTAAFAARAGGTAVEKLMNLTNRPERITESRDIVEVLRSLSARNVLKVLPPVDAETTAVEEPPEAA
jgi:hypothetical protein